MATAPPAHGDEPAPTAPRRQRADVALVVRPAKVEFVAGRGAGRVRSDYYNPGNVARAGADVTARQLKEFFSRQWQLMPAAQEIPLRQEESTA